MCSSVRMLVKTGGLLVVLAALSPFAAAQPVDEAIVAAIRDEGLSRSQVMEHVVWLSDVYGPRVTGTPAIEDARRWAMERLRAWRVGRGM